MKKKVRYLIPLLAAVSLTLAACGSSQGPPAGGDLSQSASSSTGMEQITVGVIPAVFVAPVYLGIEKGFFKEEGLEVHPELAQGGAAIVPGVVGGSFDVGFSDVVSLINAGKVGVPIKLIASGNLADQSPDNPFSAITTRTESGIKGPADLAGRTVAVNVLNNSGELTIRAVVKQAGASPDAVKFVEMPFPDMNAARDSGNVDAIWSVEPFLSLGTSDNTEIVARNYYDLDPEILVSAWFTSAELFDTAKIEKFTRGITRSSEYAQEHPDEVREIVNTYLDLPEGASEKIGLPGWTGTMDLDSVQETADRMVDLGMLESKFDVARISS